RAVRRFGAHGASAAIDAVNLSSRLGLKPRCRILIMHGVAFDLVMNHLRRNRCRGVFNLFDQTVAERTRAHVATGRTLLGEALTVVDVNREIETQSAGAAQEFDGEERTGRPCADYADATARSQIGWLRHDRSPLAQTFAVGTIEEEKRRASCVKHRRATRRVSTTRAYTQVTAHRHARSTLSTRDANEILAG